MPHLEVSDCVFSLQPGEWKCIVSGRIHGSFYSRGVAEAAMEVEQRREAARAETAYLSLPTNAPIETVLGTLESDPAIPADETPEAERRRVFGACGGKCGEAPCIAWNKENDRKEARRAARADEMTSYHADTLRKAMGVIESAMAPVVPAETAPLYMAALNSFWLTVRSVYPNADRVTMPQAIAQAFEVAAAGVVEAWMSAYNAGGYSDVNFGG